MIEFLIELLKVFGLLTLILLLCSIIVNIFDQWMMKYRQKKAIEELLNNPDELIKFISAFDGEKDEDKED